MSIKSSFSIKDLENLSGVKAHTIRIWEKRYDLLKPERSDTNIRTYDIENLQKLLNVSLLVGNGFKISKLAKMSEDEVYSNVKSTSLKTSSNEQHINAFKLAMLNFDQELFDITYNKMLAVCSFREIFQDTFLRLLDEIGVLWMTNTITPVHERFISTLIQQKLLLNIERVQGLNEESTKVYALFLPLNEIHELGLLYLHFELLLRGYRSLYLGGSVPVENLMELQKVFTEINFVSYFTVSPGKENVMEYLNEIHDKITAGSSDCIDVFGAHIQDVDDNELPATVKIHRSLKDYVNSL
ncbi:MAG: MerR family transcriptional regulator [Salibacteraceae bacterium]